MALSAAHGIMLAHGGNTVCLRPSLRAAMTFERLHGGFTGLFRRLRDFDTATITTVIEVAATDQRQASDFLGTIANAPLKGFYLAAQAPLAALFEGLMPTPPATEDNTPGKGKPMPWAKVYRELYRTATGWLHWPPEAAWNATPDEITEAFAGHMAKLKAIHGAADDEADNPDQRVENVAAGLDPQFDRAGLHRLRAIQGTAS